VKAHISGTLSGAARVIMKALGVDKVGEIVRRSPALIYKWSDSTLRHFPNLRQAIDMDAEFVARGLGAPPLFVAYAGLLRDVVSADRQSGYEILPNATKIVNLACKILVQIGTHMPAAGADSNVIPATRRAIAQDLRELNDLVTAARWSFESDPSEMIRPMEKTLMKKSEDAVCH